VRGGVGGSFGATRLDRVWGDKKMLGQKPASLQQRKTEPLLPNNPPNPPPPRPEPSAPSPQHPPTPHMSAAVNRYSSSVAANATVSPTSRSAPPPPPPASDDDGPPRSASDTSATASDCRQMRTVPPRKRWSETRCSAKREALGLGLGLGLVGLRLGWGLGWVFGVEER